MAKTLNVAIAGAGISGFTAAISLRRSGHRVTIYERSSLKKEVGAAIHFPPNAGRFLIPWGLDPVKNRFVASKGVWIISPTTLDVWQFHDYEHNEKVFGQPLYHAHRVDLHESLKRIATEPDGLGIPVTVHSKSNVVSYNPDLPSLTLQDGTVITADLIIAADGVNSIATEVVNGKTTAPEIENEVNSCYRFLISKSELAEDPETSWVNEGEGNLGCRLWPDPKGRRRLVEYSCRNYEVHNFVAMCHNDDVFSKKEDWHAAVDKTEVLEKFAGYHPKLLAAIKNSKATEVKRWPLLYRAPIRTWIKGKMALAGDAAHPMLPHHGQGGAQGMEDGLALGLVMAGITDVSQIPARLEIYEKIRRNRAASIQVISKIGMDEELPPELAQFLEGRNFPENLREVHMLEYSDCVLQKTIDEMTKYDPEWKLPDDFFPASVEHSESNGPDATKTKAE